MRSERPIFSSSSTIRMRLDAMSSHGQQHAETSAAQFSFHHNNVSAIEQGAFARDGKSQPHSPFLEGDGRLKQAGARLFQPTISFKKRGMGLGLSIARKSALLNGGDIVVVKGELGGAGFRVLLPVATHGIQTHPDRG